MGYYNVVRPCVVGKRHYARPTAQPIEVDDALAAPLVAEGNLEPYLPATPEPDDEREDTTAEAGGEVAEPAEPAEDSTAPKAEPVRRGRVRRSGADS